MKHGLWVIRSDVAGRSDGLVSYGSSAVVDPDGNVVRTANPLEQDLLAVEFETGRRRLGDRHRKSAEHEVQRGMTSGGGR